ncbi:hypothetical protein Pla123a_46710 [Posidoniimonas polymericola]|uniref:Uncharacterized protein n=1 Tax=Posidoniimonas polymericola TaxID=2528002 RepID=A0A5C5XSR2_9BACT|nr:hypothetical protein [Posidoniimonas polymericola]TWT66277.1 hypothetical protein Pla123a_46710 [Posidoniimonas polymericola]
MTESDWTASEWPSSAAAEAAPPGDAMEESPGGFRVSLKWWLISLVVLGAGMGLMGRLWMYDHYVFLGVLAMGSLVAPLLIALATYAVLAWRRRTRQQRWGWLAGLIAVTVLIPVVGLSSVVALEWFIDNRPSPYLASSTGYLVHTELPKDLDYNSDVWDELERRAASDQLTPEQADHVASLFLDHIQDENSGWDETVSYQSGFFATSLKRRLVQKPVVLSICDEYYGQTPTIRLAKPVDLNARRVRFTIDLGNELGEMTGAPFDLAINLLEVRVNGAATPFEAEAALADEYSSAASRRVYACELPPGTEAVELAADLDLAYVESLWDVNDYGGPTLGSLTHQAPPEVHRRWRATVTKEFGKVAALEREALALVTDAARDPGVGEVLQVSSVRVWRAEDERRRVELLGCWSPWMSGCFGDETPMIPCAFTVEMKIDEQSIPLGKGIAHTMKDEDYESAPFLLTAELDSLPAEVNKVDLVLTPAPELFEADAEVTEIWGQTETFSSVPLTRLDLAEIDETKTGESEESDE